MSYEEYEDGLIVEIETGDIIEIPAAWGLEPLQHALRARVAAAEERKGWDARLGALDAVIRHEMGAERRRVFEDVVGRIQANPPSFDREDYQRFMASLPEMSHEDMRGLLMAARGFRVDDVPEILREAIASFHRSTGTHVRVERVRKPAPRRRVTEAAEPDLTGDLERSLAAVAK